MIEKFKNFINEWRNKVREDEVFDRLSFNIWKTRNRILEEIDAVRIAKKEAPTNSEAFWWTPKITTRRILTNLLIRNIVEMKYESELTSTEIAWASKSESDADDKEANFRKYIDLRPEVAFYRLKGCEGKRKPKELPEGVIEPTIAS